MASRLLSWVSLPQGIETGIVGLNRVSFANHPMTRRQLLATATLLPVSRHLTAQTSPETGFTSLFDGTTLQGWTVREGPESAFYVNDGAIVAHESAGFPAWLRSDRQYENFDFRGEYFLKGWMNSGIYFHAPEHGRSAWCGMKLNIFHQQTAPAPESAGSIFPVLAPRKVNVKPNGEWNSFRILMSWPRLQVWSNDELVHDVDVEAVPELRHRLRSGYLGLESLSYPIRFRNLRIKELPSTVSWTALYEAPADLSKWKISEGKPQFSGLGNVLHSEGLGHLGTVEKYRDFELQMYVRHSLHHNGGVLFRGEGTGNKGPHYEIQLHDVEGAHYPTGSLYTFQRASYPRIEALQWWLFQLRVKGTECMVRINGDTVLEYARLENMNEGPIELQAHENGKFTEYKHVQIRRI